MSSPADSGAPASVDPRDDSLVKSRKRVADHGEVFTPSWMVEDMLDLVKYESERIDSRFLEPACGSGNFLVKVLQRKLVTVEQQFGKSEFEKRHHALFALMCVYGIELLEDNTNECRLNLLRVFADYLGIADDSVWSSAGQKVLAANIIQGDALNMISLQGSPLIFPEWAYLSKGRFQRRDFLFDNLTQRSDVNDANMLWQHFAEHEIFTPITTYPPQTVEDIAA
jgi:hypothetical protein